MSDKTNHPVKDAQSDHEPVIPAHVSLPEITFRGVVLGIILTIVLASANAYLGLKVGNTVSASIPAAVISMGILRFFRTANILENTMVQIMASTGEALTAGVSFILPALIILHIWHKFDYWQTVMVALLGGGLGVLFTIPLRRALLRDKSLRYPEAVAIANVLKASSTREKSDLTALTIGGFVGSFIALLQTGFQILGDTFQYWIKTPTTIFGFGLGFSPALIAAGYITGLSVAISLLVGVVIGWLAGVPIITLVYGMPINGSATEIANMIWTTHIRYLGVGTMMIGGLWTICTLFKPVIESISASFASLREVKKTGKTSELRTERDIPIHFVVIAAFLLLIPIFLLIAYTMVPSGDIISNTFRYFLSGFSAIYILIIGFIVCSISAYFAGLIGSTNNPVSGLLVSALLIICVIFMIFFSTQTWSPEVEENIGAVLAIGSMVIIGGALAISNDTMQDLKVGLIVGATPWKQQLMLILGVIVTAFVVPPVLELLYNAYGIGGVFPRANMDPSQMLAAPQAGLMASIAKGAFSHQLEWSMIITGAVVAVACIIIDEILKKYFNLRLPVLAVGLGIYLPLDSSMPVVIGGVLSYIVQSRLKYMYQHKKASTDASLQTHKHRGLLLTCGMVAGASLMGVIIAIPFAIKQSSDALKIMPESLMPYAGMFGLLSTLALCIWIYHYILKR